MWQLVLAVFEHVRSFDKAIAGEHAVLLSGKSISCIDAITLKRAG